MTHRYYFVKSLLWADQWNIRDHDKPGTVPAVAFSEEMAQEICRALNDQSVSGSQPRISWPRAM
jgi:hypothetical protein